MNSMLLDFFVILSACLAVFAGLNTIFVAQGGVRIVDKYFDWPLSDWTNIIHLHVVFDLTLSTVTGI